MLENVLMYPIAVNRCASGSDLLFLMKSLKAVNCSDIFEKGYSINPP